MFYSIIEVRFLMKLKKLHARFVKSKITANWIWSQLRTKINTIFSSLYIKLITISLFTLSFNSIHNENHVIDFIIIMIPI